MNAPAEVIAAERREARASWRRMGGSQRRPLKSFSTAEEKKARRLEHADRLAAAVETLQTPAGFDAWLLSLELNPDVSPLNAALIAHQAPGEIAGTAAFWKRQGVRIPKGERAGLWITGPMFYPRAAWTAAQVGALELERMAQDAADARAEVEGAGELLEELTSRLEAGEKSREVCGELAERLELRELAA